MKKSDIVLIGLVLVIIVLSMFSTKGNIKEEKLDFPLELSGEVGFNEVTYSEYKEMVESNKPFVVVITRDGCGYCDMFVPIIKEYAETNKVAITYIDIAKLDEKDFNDLSNSNRYLKKNQWGTPTTLFMKGERIIGSIDGAREKKDVEEFFKDKIVIGE